MTQVEYIKLAVRNKFVALFFYDVKDGLLFPLKFGCWMIGLEVLRALVLR